MNTAGYPTLHDIQQHNATVKDRSIVEAVSFAAPAFARQAARTINGTVFDTYLSTGVPRIGFRKANDGVAPGKPTYEMKHHECFILNGIIKADEMVLESSTDSEAQVKAELQMRNAQGLSFSLEHQIFYGTDFDPLGFPGFRQLIGDYMTISADPAKNTDTAANRADNSGASAWLVVERAEYGGIIFGKSQGIKWSPWKQQYIAGNNGQDMSAQICHVSAWIGAFSKSPYFLVRIKNLSETNPLTDKLVQAALQPFAVARPTSLYTTKKQVQLLQDSRTNKFVFINNNNGGQSVNAPTPETYQGWLPIIGTDGLLDDESPDSIKALAEKRAFTQTKQTVLQK